ncbi:hypothetical protein VST7929_00357 [Vibrio stylophorae]|uniref:Thiamine transport system permease protein ThiP n=1 Tax=Vibrio stylophorae TaxID=659351 RepID=A0ABM8ZQG4_9VIBR|nr:thiamine/thiamine pyrophosphate ABC transporter permease [Vibrio stylophorae]CAH0532527.1 hypothetical protein VST7929_00357 [Vibrio stylophorae]
MAASTRAVMHALQTITRLNLSLNHKLRRAIPSMGVWLAAALLALLILCFYQLFHAAPALNWQALWQDPYLRHLSQFSLYQAALSTLLSVLLGIPCAIALYRSQWRGKALLLQLCGLTLVLPVFIAVFGILALYGNRGLVTQWFEFGPHYNIYGLPGILLVHLFLNGPFATRLFYQALLNLPQAQQQQAQQLNLYGFYAFYLLYWPTLKRVLPSVLSLIFMLCFTSFAAVMVMGGGPQSSTLEVAIYQAIRYDLDYGYGALIALWQMVLCSALFLLFYRFQPKQSSWRQFRAQQSSVYRASAWDHLWLGILCLCLLPPLIITVKQGISSASLQLLSQSSLWQALWTSLQIALVASLLAAMFALGLVQTLKRWRYRHWHRRATLLELCASLILVLPAVMLSAGLFLWLWQRDWAYDYGKLTIMLINAVMALPYMMRAISAPAISAHFTYHQLNQSLGLSRWQQRWLIDLPLLKRPILQGMALSFLLSLGDISAIAIFGHQDLMTLPMYLYQLMDSYQMQAAAGVALLMLLLSLLLFVLAEWASKEKSRV